MHDSYDRRSLLALALLITTGSAVGYHWSDLLDANGSMDWLLGATWLLMAALLCLGVNARRDLLLLAVGLCGGTVIEWWGTNTLLWSYFTDERPPPWILPAWPIAALTIDRLARLLERPVLALERRRRRAFGERSFRVFYFAVLPAFVVALFAFVWPSLQKPATQVVLVIVAFVTLRCPNARRDAFLFVAGSALGVLLEYWGTSRQCWTYYTQEVPPPVTVFAHGFASVAFARVHAFAERLLDGALDRLTGNPRIPADAALRRASCDPPGRSAGRL